MSFVKWVIVLWCVSLLVLPVSYSTEVCFSEQEAKDLLIKLKEGESLKEETEKLYILVQTLTQQNEVLKEQNTQLKEMNQLLKTQVLLLENLLVSERKSRFTDSLKYLFTGLFIGISATAVFVLF